MGAHAAVQERGRLNRSSFERTSKGQNIQVISAAETNKRDQRRVDDEFYGLALNRVKMPSEGPKVARKKGKSKSEDIPEG